MQPGRQKQDLTIVVENAYHYDPEQANPVLLAEMGFLTLCANAYMRKPVAVKRLEEKRKKAPSVPFSYSGKADPVTTSPLQTSARLARAPFRARGRSNLNRLVVPQLHDYSIEELTQVSTIT